MAEIKKKMVTSAVADYISLNKGGLTDPIYGRLMLDRRNGDVWTDMLCSIGHNDWYEYHSAAIIDLGREIECDLETVTCDTVIEYGTRILEQYAARQQ